MSEFQELFSDWLTETVTVEPYLGRSFDGGLNYGPPVAVEGVMVDATARMVRNSDGDEALSETTLQVPDEVGDKFHPLDQVTVGGHITTVLRVASPHVYGLFSFKVVNLE